MKKLVQQEHIGVILLALMLLGMMTSCGSLSYVDTEETCYQNDGKWINFDDGTTGCDYYPENKNHDRKH